jgi:hypothetical protein
VPCAAYCMHAAGQDTGIALASMGLVAALCDNVIGRSCI